MSTRHLPLLARLVEASPWALRHLVLSLGLAALTAFLVFGVWFPVPYRELSGGLTLFLLILSVDVICGPLLTLLLLHPSKARHLLILDGVLIACVQLGALAYGMYSLSLARPVAVVFEADRFRVVAYADIQEADLPKAPEWVRPLGFSPPQVLGTRRARTGAEKLDSVNASVQGVEPGQRPDWWQDYGLSVPRVLERAHSLELLQQINPGKIEGIQMAAARAALWPEADETSSPNALRWLPLVSRQTMDWVVLLDPVTARIRGYVQANGFRP